MWASICNHLCSFRSRRSRMQEEIDELQEHIKQLQNERSDLDAKGMILRANLSETESKITAMGNAASEAKKALQDEIKTVEAKVEEFIGHSNSEQTSFKELLETLQSNYHSLHEQDLEAIAQFRIGTRSVEPS